MKSQEVKSNSFSEMDVIERFKCYIRKNKELNGIIEWLRLEKIFKII